MLILAKSILGLMLSFFISLLAGFALIPALRKLKFGQSINKFVEFSHKEKQGTPTIGGLIFIIPTIITMLLLYIKGSVELTHTIGIIIFVFVSYALLGFADDYKKIKSKSNFGLNTKTKLIVQVIIAMCFFYMFMKGGENTLLNISALGLKVDLSWFYGVFILFLLVGSSNAVNITDGLDGLAGGLSLIAFFAFGVISWGTTYVTGYQEIAIFCFVLCGSLLGFLVFNSHPARVFMGDTGSLALGATLATIAILTRHELSLAVIGGVFVIETLSSLIQIIAIRKFHRKVFLIAPLHHHFEKLGWAETDIVKMFWIVGFMLAMSAIYYGVWL